MVKWIRAKEGVRYWEHSERKHGIGPDKYYAIYFRVDGRPKEQGLGWASQGWNASKAAAELAKLKHAKVTGEGAVTLAERRKIAERERKKQAAVNITFAELWDQDYSPQAQARLKPKSYEREEQIYRLWISPRLGGRAVRDVRDVDVEVIVDNMRVAGQTPRSIEYMLGVVNRLWKLALRRGIVEIASPTSRIDKPKVNNTRLRCFTPDELRRMLEALLTRDSQAYDLTFFCALTGCRFSEAASLRWDYVDLARECVTFTTTKNREPREAFLAPELLELVEKRGPGRLGEYVFTRANGEPWQVVPDAFRAVVRDLKLNDGRSPRERLTFHSLRHTAATHAARRGVPVKDMQQIFGWKTPSMVFRYAKGSEDVQRRAARGIAQSLLGQEGKVLPFLGGKAAGDD